jgi:hypothetical protein
MSIMRVRGREEMLKVAKIFGRYGSPKWEQRITSSAKSPKGARDGLSIYSHRNDLGWEDKDFPLRLAIHSETGDEHVNVEDFESPEGFYKARALTHRFYAQYIGCNLLRSAFQKCGIANHWASFSRQDTRKLIGWNDMTRVIPAYKGPLGGTRVSEGVGRCVNTLLKRPEERRIALIISDGSFDNIDHNSNTLSGVGRCDLGRRVSTKTEIESAWKKGVEVYYLGINISASEIKAAEMLLGKGHAFSVSDTATELPKVVESIILMKTNDLRKISKGKGFAIKG